MNERQCNQQVIDDFFCNEQVAAESDFSEHLAHCESCRSYFDERAAARSEWDEARQMLQAGEFDSASIADYSAGGTTLLGGSQPVSVKDVLDSLGPTDDPHRLGRLGAYEISGVVGVGGMGVVLKAVDPTLDRVVAIKVMAPQFASNDKARKRFSREARAAAAVIHPNVIPIHTVDEAGSLPYLVMTYVRGDSLQKRLDQGPLELPEILRIGSQVAAGLAAAHEQGLVHRDIKPENILLEGSVERVTLTDFGLARAVDDNSVTQNGIIAGTPMYMSPEQARGENVDQQSDLFSLGSVLYALCTGRPPYQADTSFGVMRKIIDERPTPLRGLRPDIPEWMSRIVDKLMSHNKADRFDSASEVHSLFDACLSYVQKPKENVMPVELQMLRDQTARPVVEYRQLPVEAPKRLTPSFGSFLKVIGGFAIVAILGAAGFFLMGNGERTAKADYQKLKQFLQTGKCDEYHSEIADRMLKSKEGRKNLRILDSEDPRLAYTEGKFANGFTSVVAYTYDDIGPNGSSPEIMLRGRSLTTMGTATRSFYRGYQLDSIRFDNAPDERCRVIIEYTTAGADTPLIGLKPDSRYKVEMPLNRLIEGPGNLTELFSEEGTLIGDGVRDQNTGTKVTLSATEGSTESTKSTLIKDGPLPEQERHDSKEAERGTHKGIEEQIRRGVDEQHAPKTEAMANLAISRIRMKAIVNAMTDYYKSKQQWPEKLEDLISFLPTSDADAVFVNPLTGDNPGYEYVKPTSPLEDVKPDETVVLYQLRDGKRDTKLERACLAGWLFRDGSKLLWPKTASNQAQNQASSSGLYTLSVPHKLQTKTGELVWMVTITSRDGSILYQDKDSRMWRGANAYFGWDKEDRVWLYYSDDSSIWRWELADGNWNKVRAERNDGMPVWILPDYEKKTDEE